MTTLTMTTATSRTRTRMSNSLRSHPPQCCCCGGGGGGGLHARRHTNAKNECCSRLRLSCDFSSMIASVCIVVCLLVVQCAVPSDAAVPHTASNNRIDDLHRERVHDGPASPHAAHGDHHKFDHEAILGSKDSVDEFDDLPPDEAKRRLRVIAQRMDINNDGNVDRDELRKWILNSFDTLTHEESLERFEDEDRNKDGKVSWEEHYAETFGQGSSLHEHHEDDLPRMLEEDRELFAVADMNHDGFLNKDEFPAFSHPHEFPKMHEILVNQTMRKKDTDKDGKLSLDEFLSEDDGSDMSEEARVAEKERFEMDLDRDKDGRLNAEEVKKWMVPDNGDIADQEVDHLMDNSDSDKNGVLSIQEIVDHHDIFVGSEATDYGEHLHKLRDEL